MAVAVRLLRRWRERRVLKKLVIPAAILLIAGTAWFYGRKPEIPAVPFAKVTRETLVSTLPTNGKIEPLEWAPVRAEGSGVVDRVAVHDGQVVKQGHLLATLRISGAAPSLAGAGDRSVAEAQLREGQAAAAAARLRAAQSEIRSPLSGVVYSLTARAGAYLNPGDPIANVGRLDRLIVRVYVDEPELGRVTTGEPVTITWDAL